MTMYSREWAKREKIKWMNIYPIEGCDWKCPFVFYCLLSSILYYLLNVFLIVVAVVFCAYSLISFLVLSLICLCTCIGATCVSLVAAFSNSVSLSRPNYSYCSLIDIADHLFPPIREDKWSGYDEYSNFNFWRDPVPDIPLDDVLLAGSGGTPPSKSSPKGKAQKQQQQKTNNDTGRTSTSGNNAQLTTIPEK